MRDRRGVVGIASALLMTTLAGFAGLAIDTSRIWLVETRLKTAVDAAALMAARRLTAPTRDAEARAVFWAHFTQRGGRRDYLGATVGDPVITPDPRDASRIRVSATARLQTTLFSLISSQEAVRTESAVAQRAGMGLELAIVLDQTSSMRESAGGGLGSKLDAAKSAVRTMLNILYAGQDSQRNLFVSVVPFARTINIGTGPEARAMLDTTGMPAGWALANWTGCVEARRGGRDATDEAPVGAGRFRPYFWRSTWRQVGTATSRCTTGNAYPAVGGVRYCHGDNDWGSTQTQAELNANYMYDDLRDEGFAVGAAWGDAVGPNLLCALNPIQPLTVSRMTVEGAVNAIQAPPRSGGTTTVVGLQGAWYTLSPNWQNAWQDPNAGIPNLPVLPVNYNTPFMRKAVVMLTDGDDKWQPAYGNGCGSSRDSVCSSATGTELLYNAYGRVADWNANFPAARITTVTEAGADPRLADRFAALCEAIKDAGITVYVIGFEVASGDRTRLRNCATSTNHYYESPTAATLTTVFTEIAAQLSTLRLAE